MPGMAYPLIPVMGRQKPKASWSSLASLAKPASAKPMRYPAMHTQKGEQHSKEQHSTLSYGVYMYTYMHVYPIYYTYHTYNTHHTYINTNILTSRAAVAHTFNPSTWEAEVGRFLSLRPAWSTK